MLSREENYERQPETYERFYAIAVGRMGIRPQDFDDMTFAQFTYSYWGWLSGQVAAYRQNMECIRWEVYNLNIIQLKEKPSITELYPFPWDTQASKPKIDPYSPESQAKAKRLLDILNRELDRKNGKNSGHTD